MFAAKFSAVQVGLPVCDLGLGLADTFSHNPVVPEMGLGVAALHALRGAAFLASAHHQSGVRLEQRLGIAGGSALLAAGHVLGAMGAGAWCLPVLAAGTAVSTIADYRYRSALGEG